MTYKLNTDRSAAVCTDHYWQPVSADTPLGVKVLLLNERAGVATLGQYERDSYWTHWSALPKMPDQPQPKPINRPMRVYISGPMTGLPGLNFDAFNEQAAYLRQLGYDVVNPAEINPDTSMAWADCMRADIAALTTCTHIVLLPGWHASRGAVLEHHIAERLGMVVWDAMCPDDHETMEA